MHNDFETNFEKVCLELEQLNDTFLIKGIPDEYKEIWVPNGEIKLWSVPRTSGQLLRAFVLASRAKVILELGTSSGYSALWLASAARQLGGTVHTIELAKPKIQLAKGFFKKARLEDHIHQIEGKIADILSKWDIPIDLVFLDADKPNYFSYIKQIEPFLKSGSVVIADNAIDFSSYMKDYLEYVLTNQAYSSQLLKIDHGLMISVRQ